MADITLSIDSAAARNTFAAAPGKLDMAMRGGMEDSTTYVLARIRRYPPERPNQRYIRTGTLNRSWSRRIEGSGLSIRGIVGSNGAMAPYNRLVQDRQHQSRVHRGRWQTIQDVAEQEQNTVVRMFADRLAAAGLERP
jgi:hypothetical protein